jgi:hypothetical protein
MQSKPETVLEKIMFFNHKIISMIFFCVLLCYVSLYILIFRPFFYNLYPEYKNLIIFKILLYIILFLGVLVLFIITGIIGKIVFKNTIIICPFCAEKNRGDRTFCEHCGEKLRIFSNIR